MKVNIEIDMTPDETREVTEPPDGGKLQERFVIEMQKRTIAALEGSDPQALLKARMPLGGFEQFQKFLWDGAKRAAEAKKSQSAR